MRTVERPTIEPAELGELKQGGGEDFGPLAHSLDVVFAGVCAYCERTTGDDDSDLTTRLFFCDHFRPRHLLCHQNPSVGQCTDRPPPHSADCPIYDWANLVYTCGSCADAKGGQWPRPGDSADGYINPAGARDAADAPEEVFAYDVSSGRILARDNINGVVRNNAQRTIGDLALNEPRGPRHQGTAYAAKDRRINLAELRGQWVKRLQETLDRIGSAGPDVLRYVIDEHVHPSCRFSSICLQFVRESKYSIYV